MKKKEKERKIMKRKMKKENERNSKKIEID
jgi:hypothetical protein